MIRCILINAHQESLGGYFQVAVALYMSEWMLLCSERGARLFSRWCGNVLCWIWGGGGKAYGRQAVHARIGLHTLNRPVATTYIQLFLSSIEQRESNLFIRLTIDLIVRVWECCPCWHGRAIFTVASPTYLACRFYECDTQILMI